MKIKGMMSVEKDLPEVNKDVICFGIGNDGETKVEEGFRNFFDLDNKPYEWADFSYIVTHWIYSPVIEVEEKECSCKNKIHDYCEVHEGFFGGFKI